MWGHLWFIGLRACYSAMHQVSATDCSSREGARRNEWFFIRVDHAYMCTYYVEILVHAHTCKTAQGRAQGNSDGEAPRRFSTSILLRQCSECCWQLTFVVVGVIVRTVAACRECCDSYGSCDSGSSSAMFWSISRFANDASFSLFRLLPFDVTLRVFSVYGISVYGVYICGLFGSGTRSRVCRE